MQNFHVQTQSYRTLGRQTLSDIFKLLSSVPVLDFFSLSAALERRLCCHLLACWQTADNHGWIFKIKYFTHLIAQVFSYFYSSPLFRRNNHILWRLPAGTDLQHCNLVLQLLMLWLFLIFVYFLKSFLDNNKKQTCHSSTVEISIFMSACPKPTFRAINVLDWTWTSYYFWPHTQNVHHSHGYQQSVPHRMNEWFYKLVVM